jgi:hypothetical protein
VKQLSGQYVEELLVLPWAAIPKGVQLEVLLVVVLDLMKTR